MEAYGPRTHTYEYCFELAIINYLEHTHNYEYVPPNSLKQSFDKNLAIDKDRLFRFIELNSPEQYQEIVKYNAHNKLLDDLSSAIGSRGIIDVLKKGFRFYLNHIYSLDINLINANLNSPTAIEQERFKRNIFSVSNQVTYSTQFTRRELDLVIFINGLPILTVELKSLNSTTGENYKHAENQYRDTRNPLVDESATLLQFGRCLVHFAVDEDIVEFTTKLQGNKTRFMPFNKGRDTNGEIGAGNPLNTDDINGRKTAYLWEEIFEPKNLTRIIYSFAYTKTPQSNNQDQSSQSSTFNKFIETKRYADNNTLIFPRYHQYRVVTNLVKDVETNGVGSKYLIQHSAGSGKSNSISWLAYRLVEANYNNKRAFDLVIVITDRRNLDRQITDNIINMLSERSVVQHADSSKKLKKLLKNGGIAISTIQKFTQIVKDLNREESKDNGFNFKDKKFAIIIDEAHSSQSGKNSKNLNQVVSNKVVNNDSDDDPILSIVTSQVMPVNASFFAFTATPKPKTFMTFGNKVFDLYSMKQAIEEGFILDVLNNYITYEFYYKIRKSINDNPIMDTAKANRELSDYVKNNILTISEKSKLIVERLLNYTICQINGKAKAMLVTSSVDNAIKYYHNIKSRLKQKGLEYKCKVLIAFSGEHKDKNNNLVTESMLNGFNETKTAQEFKKPEYKLLIVANKYQTGYDEPLLHTMFVDKRISSVAAVQTLSRLNRICEGKKDTCVLDFCNTEEDIIESFSPFYTKTTASSNLTLDKLRVKLSATRSYGVFTDQELTNFTELCISNNPNINGILGICVNRFQGLTEQSQGQFKSDTSAFLHMYDTLSSIVTINEELAEEGKSWYRHALLFTVLLNRIASLSNDVDSLEQEFHLADAVCLENVYISQGTLLNNSLASATATNSLDPNIEATEQDALNSESLSKDQRATDHIDIFNPKTTTAIRTKKDNYSSIDDIINRYNETVNKYLEDVEQGHKDLDKISSNLITNDMIRNTVKDYCEETPNFLDLENNSTVKDSTLNTIEDGVRNIIKDPSVNLEDSELKDKYARNPEFLKTVNKKILLDIIQSLSSSVQEINNKLTDLGNNFNSLS